MIDIPNPSKANTVTLYEMEDAAGMIGISVATLCYHLKQGNIEPIKIGQKNVFTFETVRAFVESRQPPGRPKGDAA